MSMFASQKNGIDKYKKFKQKIDKFYKKVVQIDDSLATEDNKKKQQYQMLNVIDVGEQIQAQIKQLSYHFFLFIVSDNQNDNKKRQQISVLYKIVHSFYLILKNPSSTSTLVENLIFQIRYFYLYCQEFKSSLNTIIKNDQQQLERLINLSITILKNSNSPTDWKQVVENYKQSQKKNLQILRQDPFWKFFREVFSRPDAISLINFYQKIKSFSIDTKYTIIWLYQLNKFYTEKRKITLHPCCEIFFQKDKKYQLGNSQLNQYIFQDIKFSSQKQKQADLQKLLVNPYVGFLNSTGGNIYFGFRKDSQDIKGIKSVGVQLSLQLLPQLIKKLKIIFDNIHPNLKEEQKNHDKIIQQEIKQFRTSRLVNTIKINKYVRVSIIRFIEKPYNILSQQNRYNNKVYFSCILKIQIKQSSKIDTFSTIDENKNVLCFKRDKEGITHKLKVSQYLDLIDQRLTQFFRKQKPSFQTCEHCKIQYVNQKTD